jgi:hypothetical protein
MIYSANRDKDPNSESTKGNMKKNVTNSTIDPAQIVSASEIPPAGAQRVGLSPEGQVDVFCGTLHGDIDALPSASELLESAPANNGLANADYIYNQVPALYGGVQLPGFQSPSGDTVKSVVFVSGSGQQPNYGAFHIPGTQADFDRIVCDSMNASGSYSNGSGLGLRRGLVTIRVPHLFSAIGLGRATACPTGDRQYLSTALFAAEIVESFQLLTGTASAGLTDGESVSRVVAFKLAPEIALIPGFNSAVTQQWWADGHPDFVNDNSQSDQSTDGNGAGVMFLEFLNDFLGISLSQVIGHMPKTGGAPLGDTYVNLLQDFPALASVAGQDGGSAFAKMVSLLHDNSQTTSGTLTLPENGNPFPMMPGAKQGGLFAGLTLERRGLLGKANRSVPKGRSNQFPQAEDAVHRKGRDPERILGHKGRTVAK